MLAFALILGYVMLVLVRPQEYPAWAGNAPPVMPVFLALALVAWIASRSKRFDAPQYLLLAAFTLATSLSVLVNGWSGGALAQLSTFTPTFLAFLLLANATDNAQRLRLVMCLFALAAGLLALHGIFQKRDGIGWTGMPLVDDGRIQYVGIFSDPNDLGMLFVICLPMALYLSQRGGAFGLRRLFWAALAGLLLYGIWLTNSRGSMLAVVAMVGAWLWIRRGPVLAGLLGAAALVGMRMMPSRLSDLSVQESSASGRVDAWYEGFRMFVSHPVFGVGTGRFTDFHWLTAHNSLVLVLAENGIIGFMLWVAFVGYCFWMMLRLLRHRPDAGLEEAGDGAFGEGMPATEIDEDAAWEAALEWEADRRIALTLLLSLVGFATTAFFLSRTYVVLPYLLAALVVAHFGAVRRRYGGIAGFSLTSDAPRWALYMGLVLAGFYVLLKLLLGMS